MKSKEDTIQRNRVKTTKSDTIYKNITELRTNVSVIAIHTSGF